MTFRLSRHGREAYEQLITTEPPILAWDASFDDGETWHAGEAIPGEPGWYRWLLAGDLAAQGDAVAVVHPTTDDIEVLARGTANPELIVRGLEPVRVT